jgi:uncharacterized protein YjcR
MIPSAKDRWTAARAIYQNEQPSLEQIAALSGWSPQTIRARAAREGWLRSDAPQRKDRNARVAKVVDRLLGEIEALGIGTGEGAIGLDKARIEAISALMRTLEKIGELTRSEESVDVKESQTKRDADIAGFLKRIDERIVELATGYAKQLVRGKPQG